MDRRLGRVGRLDPAAADSQQIAQLKLIFPQGVCDWHATGRYQAPFQGNWLSFGPSSGTDLGAPPGPDRNRDARR